MPLVSHLYLSLAVTRRAKSFNLQQHSIARAARDIVNRFKLSPAAQRLTLELTGRAFNAITDKLTMKAALFALRLNELLGIVHFKQIALSNPGRSAF
jgi:hypothetical protein